MTSSNQIPPRRTAAVVAMLALSSTTVFAAPKSKEARAHFDRGVAAYTKGDFAAASEALAAAFTLEADDETLFAWAQSERKQGRCETAIELYNQLLAMPLPAENKQAIEEQIAECKELMAAEQAAAAMLEPPPVTPLDAQPKDSPPPVTASDETRTWWKDPVGGALVGAGVVGLALGTVFVVQGKNADDDKASAGTYDKYRALDDRAKSRGTLGVISLVAGGVLATAGVVWYVTRAPGSERAVTGWLSPSGGGVALGGRF